MVIGIEEINEFGQLDISLFWCHLIINWLKLLTVVGNEKTILKQDNRNQTKPAIKRHS